MTSPVAFKAFRQFNDPDMRKNTGLKHRISHRIAPCFQETRHMDRLALALSRRRAVPIKEVFESFEFYMRVRKRVRSPVMADLCCGHGLTGLLFAAFERTVEHVVLLDHQRPGNHDAVYESVMEVAPWVKDKTHYLEVPVEEASSHLRPGCGIVAVHACGVRTDWCLDVALALSGPIAVMPCCYFQTSRGVPRSVRKAVGAELSTDIDRTYRLEREGYRVEWLSIPPEITPMNRILVASTTC